MSEAIIIGGGPSLRGFDFRRLKGRTCFCANYSVFDVPSPTCFVTVDQTFIHKISHRLVEFRALEAKKVFIVNMATGFLVEQSGRIIDRRMGLVYDFDHFNQVIKSYREDGIGQTLDDFRNGANSGYAALQLALLQGHTDIKLLGVDLMVNTYSHYHSGYSGIRTGFLDKFLNHFKTGLTAIPSTYPGVRITSCSPISRLNAIIEYQPFK